MLKIRDIVRLNADTFYKNNSDKRRPLWPRYLIIAIISLALSYILRKESDNLCLGIITAQSILVGFSFNVLFFLVANRKIIIVETNIIEKKARADRINALGKEMFYNVSYYNVVALISVVLSIILLMSGAIQDNLSKDILQHLGVTEPIIAQLRSAGEPILHDAGYFVIFLTYATLIESLLTFFRTVQRITYYFDARIKLGD